MSRPTIGFAGMTHLGLVSASAVAAKGFATICYDADEALVARLSRGELHVVEPDLDETIRGNGARQSFSCDIARLRECDVVYISPDVPTDDNGTSDLSGIRDLIARVTAVLDERAILVVLCQVPPGFTRSLTAPPRVRRYYQVETLVFGRAVERAMQPERFIIGCEDSAQPLAAPFRALLDAFGCPILPMRYESAELAKISINMCLVASIGVANTLAELCEAIGADWSEIAPSLKLDRRIGPHSYLSPGLGIAGGNLERDLATVIAFADQHKTDAGIVRAWLDNSRHRRDWAARTVQCILLDAKPQAAVAVWGLAYKENTHSVKNSPSLATLAQWPTASLRLHDPVVSAESVAHPNKMAAQDPLDAVRDADALAILTPWPQYREIKPRDIAAAMRGRIVLDPYRVLDASQCRAAGLDYYTLGVPPMPAAQPEGA